MIEVEAYFKNTFNINKLTTSTNKFIFFFSKKKNICIYRYETIFNILSTPSSIMTNQIKHPIPLPLLVAQIILLTFLIFCKITSAITEIEALLKWKSSLPKQSILDSWVITTPSNLSSSKASTNPCQWYGITCNNGSNVIEINLAYTGLNGTLENLDFASFPNLLRLDLKVNNLNGSIPPSIGLLNKLQYLDLSTNSLNSTLPPSLANLTEVYELDISRNYITGGLDPSFFPSKGSKVGLKSMKNFLMQDTKVRRISI